MSCGLITCCCLVILAFEPPPRIDNSFTLDDIEQRAESHRRLIRMCGPLSVVRTCALNGRSVDVDATLARYRCRRDQGVTVREVLELSRDLGLEARAIRLDQLSLTRLPTPSIILINNDQHCVVLESVTTRDRIAKVWDPADLTTKEIDIETLNKWWSGHAIVFDKMLITDWLIDAANIGAVFVTISLLAWSRRSVYNKERT